MVQNTHSHAVAGLAHSRIAWVHGVTGAAAAQHATRLQRTLLLGQLPTEAQHAPQQTALSRHGHAAEATAA
jgi:hypothetical protein